MKILGLFVIMIMCMVGRTADYIIVAHHSISQTEGAIPVLLKKYAHWNAKVLVYQDQVTEVLKSLQKERPRYICFFPEETKAGRNFVAAVHQMTRNIDKDPYTDAIWGIVVGDLKKQIANDLKPLHIKWVLTNTYLAEDRLDQYTMMSELKPGVVFEKNKKITNASTELAINMAKELNKDKVDLVVSSAHASERDWRPGFTFNGGIFRVKEGELYAYNSREQEELKVCSTQPKLLLACGNCLMGHYDRSQNCMASGWFRSAKVTQMIGYTVPTWFGYMGWGVVDYFIEQPGRFTFAEAFFANQQALLQILTTGVNDCGQKIMNREGYQFDSNVVAFYGDPAWEARMMPGSLNWEQTLTKEGDIYTLTIKPLKGNASFLPVNNNGSQRGFRPILAFFPKRIGEAKVLRSDLATTITDDFILVKLPTSKEIKDQYIIKFQASLYE